VPVRAEGETTWCPLNFVGEAVPGESVIEIEAINRPLSVMARMHDGGAGRVALADLAEG
jgi:hypothetical protein